MWLIVGVYIYIHNYLYLYIYIYIYIPLYTQLNEHRHNWWYLQVAWTNPAPDPRWSTLAWPRLVHAGSSWRDSNHKILPKQRSNHCCWRWPCLAVACCGMLWLSFPPIWGPTNWKKSACRFRVLGRDYFIMFRDSHNQYLYLSMFSIKQSGGFNGSP